MEKPRSKKNAPVLKSDSLSAASQGRPRVFKYSPLEPACAGRDSGRGNPTKAKQFASVPKHIVLFPDGNRRWAKERGLKLLQGHLAGKNNFEGFLQWCKARGVEVVTVFGFSTENWDRSKEEVEYLMNLFETYLGGQENIRKFNDQGVRVRVVGQKERLRPSLQNVISRVEDATKNNTEFSLNLAVSYGGKWDIVQAAKRMAKDRGEITEEAFDQYLSTAGLPDPDLVIRAGGEQRFSNFLLWQSAYAELYFCKKYWPDFSEEDFNDALAEYANRKRRFGR